MAINTPLSRGGRDGTDVSKVIQDFWSHETNVNEIEMNLLKVININMIEKKYICLGCKTFISYSVVKFISKKYL